MVLSLFRFTIGRFVSCKQKKLGIIQSSKTFRIEEGDFIEKESDFDTPCYWHYFTKPEIKELMQNSGFEVLECKLMSELEQGGWNEIIVAVRTLLFSEQITQEVLLRLPHRQWVFYPSAFECFSNITECCFLKFQP